MAAAGMAEQLQFGDHVCVFINGVPDGLDVMAQTVAAGLGAGDKVMVLTEALRPAAVLAGLEERGVAAAPAQRTGQVQVLPAGESYRPTGRFEPARALESLLGLVDQASRDGYRGLRIVGDMTWALTDQTGVGQLAGYEARANQVYLDGRVLGVCLYDRHAFSRDQLREVTCAHPASNWRADGTGGAPLLRIRRTTDPYGLQLTGEIDLSNRQALAVVLDAVVEQQPDPAIPISVDVAGLKFADAATAALFGRFALRAPAGAHFVRPQLALATVLERLGLTRLPQLRLVGPADGAAPVRTGMVA